MATKKKVMVDDSVKVVKPVHQPKLREEREDDDRVLPRYTVEDEEEEGDIVDTEYVESPEEMKKRILDIEGNLTPLHSEREQYRIQYCLEAEDDIYKVIAPNVIEATGDQLAWLLKKHNQGNKNYATVARINELVLEKTDSNTFKAVMLRNEYIESEIEDIFIAGQILLTTEAMLPQ
jgi:hypothetical protein